MSDCVYRVVYADTGKPIGGGEGRGYGKGRQHVYLKAHTAQSVATQKTNATGIEHKVQTGRIEWEEC